VQRRQMGANKRKKWKFWENKTKITDFGRIRTCCFKFIAEENYTRFCKVLDCFS
jgi:16S rRNA G966 N2-methylase RsmD